MSTPTIFTYSDSTDSTSYDNPLMPTSRVSGKTLTSVVIGNGVTSLGLDCFYACQSLMSITIPSNVTILGENSFNSCTGLTSIIMHDGITSLGSNCFNNCTSLTSITIPKDITTLFACFVFCSNLTSITIPNKITTLGSYCFYGCSSLREVIYAKPSIITSVGANIYTNTPAMAVKFYDTTGEPSTNVYYKPMYTTGSTFEYFTGASCYNEGSKILILENGEEKYVNIEMLRRGTIVKTYLHGYKPVKIIGKNFIMNDVDNNLKSMYKINDLIVTGEHCLLIDDLSCGENSVSAEQNRKIDDKYCLLVCDYEKAEKILNSSVYTIYHFVLNYDESEIDGINKRYGVYTNDGILSESTSESNFIKNKFINV
jgi:hypothetical protein